MRLVIFGNGMKNPRWRGGGVLTPQKKDVILRADWLLRVNV